MSLHDDFRRPHALVPFERLEIAAHGRGVRRIDAVERREVTVFTIKRDLFLGKDLGHALIHSGCLAIGVYAATGRLKPNKFRAAFDAPVTTLRRCVDLRPEASLIRQ